MLVIEIVTGVLLYFLAYDLVPFPIKDDVKYLVIRIKQLT